MQAQQPTYSESAEGVLINWYRAIIELIDHGGFSTEIDLEEFKAEVWDVYAESIGREPEPAHITMRQFEGLSRRMADEFPTGRDDCPLMEYIESVQAGPAGHQRIAAKRVLDWLNH